MPNNQQFTIAEEDLASLKAAQKLISDNLAGQEIPLEILTSIAIRSVDALALADEALIAITGKDFRLRPEKTYV